MRELQRAVQITHFIFIFVEIYSSFELCTRTSELSRTINGKSKVIDCIVPQNFIFACISIYIYMSFVYVLFLLFFYFFFFSIFRLLWLSEFSWEHICNSVIQNAMYVCDKIGSCEKVRNCEHPQHCWFTKHDDEIGDLLHFVKSTTIFLKHKRVWHLWWILNIPIYL